MGEIEDKILEDINTKFGSIPKMAKEIGMSITTIYHALDRGIENTTSKTKKQILGAVYGDEPGVEYAVINLDKILSDEEYELIRLYRKLPPKGRKAVLVGLREYVSSKEKEQ